MHRTTASRALSDLNLTILLALRSGLSLDKTRSHLEAADPRTHAGNIPGFHLDEAAPDIGQLTAATARSYLEILARIAHIAECELSYLKNTVLGAPRERLVRTLFNCDPDDAGYSELKLPVVREVFNRLLEISARCEIPWAEMVRRLKKANGHKMVGKLFSSPEIEVETPRTLEDILADMTLGRPVLRHYQQEIVASFLKSSLDRSRMHVIALPTGGGKTLVANECVDRYLKAHEDFKVLWLAPNWVLLEQAAINMAACFGRKDELRYAGNGRKLLGLERYNRNDREARVIYATLQSWYRGGDGVFSCPTDRLMVVYDESHWGLGSTMLRNVFKKYLGKTSMLGLSATPRDSVKTQLLLPHYSFADLLKMGHLAEPRIDQIDTGVVWSPSFHAGSPFLTQQCLAVLGDNAERNRLVVDTIARRLSEFRKVLVFACNRAHADLLNNMLGLRHVACAPYHTGVDRAQRAESLKNFKTGAVKVLISVNMAVHGVDIPEIDCIVMARPTESAALCAQMVGRGARTTPDKKAFHILEFTDNLAAYIDRIIYSRDLYSAAAAPGLPAAAARQRPRHFEPGKVVFQQLTGIPGVEGLQYTVDHSFGVEIELTALPGPHGEIVPTMEQAHWHRIARALIGCVTGAGVDMSEEPTDYHEGDPARWHLEQDSSCGWEIISPPLRNQAGFNELYRVFKAVKNLVENSRELLVDFSCGLHITLSTKLNDDAKLAGFLRRVQRLEPGLFTLVKPSRLYKTSRYGYKISAPYGYCLPVRTYTVDEPGSFESWSTSRYSSVNVCKARLSDYNLIEVRMHHGSVDYLEIIPWISLWMHIFNSSRFAWCGAGCNEKVFPRGDSFVGPEMVENDDILSLIENEKIAVDNLLKTALLEKRRAMRPFWENALPERVEAWDNAGWYDVS